ncbi:MAG: hypothetical protein NTV94_04830 [Planctomycetota bacterium]|nr:hypothetical protein [Planctomycetota bacterium]
MQPTALSVLSLGAACVSVGFAQPATPAAPEPAKPAATTPKLLSPELARHLDGASVVEQLRAEAARTMRTIKCDGVRRLLVNTSWLPVIDSRKVYRDKAAHKVLSKGAYESLPEDQRSTFEPLELDEEFYYYTRYGSPLGYARALDILCKELGCKDYCFSKKRILDFGYGGIGHLRLLANSGAKVVGVDVDPMLAALYSDPGDTGEVAGASISEVKPPNGEVALVTGRWPAEPAAAAAVGKGFDIIISKNVLKNGYIHPEKEVPKQMLVDLGVDDATFLKAVAESLNSDGRFLIYNICPKQKEDQYLPWADGKCPFSKEAIAAAGLEVLEYNVEDSGEAWARR